MISEIARDDVFLLETPRLWLRWPRAADSASIARACADPSLALQTARIPHPYPDGEAEAFVARSRAANADGSALTLVATAKGDRRDLVGCLSLAPAAKSGEVEIGYWIAKPFRRRGLAAEAASRMVCAAFRLSDAASIVANVFAANAASRATLEALGFAGRGATSCDAPARGGAVDAISFELTRAQWRDLADREVAAAVARV